MVLEEFCCRYCPYFIFSERSIACRGLQPEPAHTGKVLCRTGLRKARHVIPSSQPVKLVARNQTGVCNKITFSKKAEQAAQTEAWVNLIVDLVSLNSEGLGS